MFATRFRCVSMTPFEPPVVPLEYGKATKSLSDSISGTSASSDESFSAEKGVAPGASSKLKISSIPPASSAASRAFSMKALAVMRKRAPASRSWLASSAAV